MTRIFVPSLNRTYIAVDGHVIGPKQRQAPRSWDEIVKEFERPKPDEKATDFVPEQLDSKELLIDSTSEKECSPLYDDDEWWVEPLRKIEDFDDMEGMF